MRPQTRPSLRSRLTPQSVHQTTSSYLRDFFGGSSRHIHVRRTRAWLRNRLTFLAKSVDMELDSGPNLFFNLLS